MYICKGTDADTFGRFDRRVQFSNSLHGYVFDEAFPD